MRVSYLPKKKEKEKKRSVHIIILVYWYLEGMGLLVFPLGKQLELDQEHTFALLYTLRPQSP